MNAKTNLDEDILSEILNIRNCPFFLCILKENWGFPATVVPVNLERNFFHIITICMQSNGGKQRANSKSKFWYFWNTLAHIPKNKQIHNLGQIQNNEVWLCFQNEGWLFLWICKDNFLAWCWPQRQFSRTQ